MSLIINNKDYDQIMFLSRIKLHAQIDGAVTVESLIKKEPNLLIVCEDGMPFDVKIFSNGKRLRNVEAVDFRMRPDENVTATIKVAMPRIHVMANVNFSDHK